MSHPEIERIKRLKYRCAYRGTKEMDLILRRFAETELEALSRAELDTLERLLEQPDAQLYRFLTGEARAEGDEGMLLARISKSAMRGPGARGA